MKKDSVTHRGVIKAVTPTSITILTDDDCRCDGCAVVALCNKSGEGDGGETVTIDLPDASRYRPGQRVEVTASSSATLRATLWALIVPVILFIGVLLGCNLWCSCSDTFSILMSFIALSIYWLLLWVFRRRLATGLRWQVREL